MDFVPESEDSDAGDDDKVYMFFSENAMEYDFYNKLQVSRVARVCKVRGIDVVTPRRHFLVRPSIRASRLADSLFLCGAVGLQGDMGGQRTL